MRWKQRDEISFKILSSSGSVEWPTPQWLFDLLDKEFGFTLDPCSTDLNAKCDRHFTALENGLKQDWGLETVFMNPPYGAGETGKWIKKAYEAALKGSTVICLVPSRTDTKWWHKYAMKAEIRFLRGRLTFEGSMNPAPFPSVLVIFRPPEFKLVSYPA